MQCALRGPGSPPRSPRARLEPLFPLRRSSKSSLSKNRCQRLGPIGEDVPGREEGIWRRRRGHRLSRRRCLRTSTTHLQPPSSPHSTLIHINPEPLTPAALVLLLAPSPQPALSRPPLQLPLRPPRHQPHPPHPHHPTRPLPLPLPQSKTPPTPTPTPQTHPPHLLHRRPSNPLPRPPCTTPPNTPSAASSAPSRPSTPSASASRPSRRGSSARRCGRTTRTSCVWSLRKTRG